MKTPSQHIPVQKSHPDHGNTLDIAGLGRTIGAQRVLDGIELNMPSGELLTVLGPSGSGKTTLLRLICGFDRVDSGTMWLDGKIVANGGKVHYPPERRGIGYVAQEGALFPHLDVKRNIEFGLSRRQRASVEMTELLAAVGLPGDYARRAPSALSGGEQQRVALARAQAPKPRLVLLDEPFSSLDAGLRAETRAAVATTLKTTGTTAILVTHDQEEALSMGDRIAVLQNGSFAQVDTPQAVYSRPVNRAVAGFVGEAVRVFGEGAGDCVHCCFGCLSLSPTSVPCHGPVEVLIRPEQFRVRQPLGESTSCGSSARVEHIDFYGHDARLDLKTADGIDFRAVTPGFDLPSVGDEIGFEISGQVNAYAFDGLF